MLPPPHTPFRAAIPQSDRALGHTCDSPAFLRTITTPRCAGTHIVAWHGRGHESAGARPIDPAPDCADTRRLDRIVPTGRPVHTAPETSLETIGRARGGGRALGFFLNATDSMCLSSERSARAVSVDCFILPTAGAAADRSPPDGRIFPSGHSIECGVTHPKLPAEVTNRGAGVGLSDGVHMCSSENLDRFIGPLLSCGTVEAIIVL